MRYAFAVLLNCLLFTGIATACSFRTAPVAIERYYRDSGWMLPGVKDGKMVGQNADFLGLTAINIAHPNPYVVQFASQEFEQNGKRGRIVADLLMVEDLVRYELDGKIVAYTYLFIPVNGRHVGKKWVIKTESMCDFHATYIDEKGDGVFRLLIADEMRPEFVPQWARPPKS